jgi:hypothetical protein
MQAFSAALLAGAQASLPARLQPVDVNRLSSNSCDYTQAFILSPSFADHRFDFNSSPLDRALRAFRSEYPLGRILRERHRRLDRHGCNSACNQIYVRDRFSREQEASACAARTGMGEDPRSLAQHFSGDHWDCVGRVFCTFKSQLKMGTGGGKHCFRMDTDFRAGHSDQKVDGDAFQRK